MKHLSATLKWSVFAQFIVSRPPHLNIEIEPKIVGLYASIYSRSLWDWSCQL